MMSGLNLRWSCFCVLAAALGCGGSSSNGDGQTGTDSILVPHGEDGGILGGNGGITGGTGVPGTGGVFAPAGITGGGGVPGTGGLQLDAAIGTGGVISVDGGGAPGTGGILATGGSTGTTCGEPGFLCCPGNTCSNGGCCATTNIQPFCDDRLWCTTVLQP